MADRTKQTRVELSMGTVLALVFVPPALPADPARARRPDNNHEPAHELTAGGVHLLLVRPS